MNKLIFLGIATTLGAAKLAFFPANPPVDLQPTSPGTAQTGHLNISGTATVGLLKSQGTVFGASTAPTGFAYGGFFTAASDQGRGFYGFASSPTGLTYGGFFQNASESGRAVYGLATSTTGFNYGGYFQSASIDGRGLIGVAAAATGTTYGVYGTAVSLNGYGVFSDGNLHATGNITGAGQRNNFSGFTSVGPRTSPLTSSEVFGVSSSAAGYGGMYVTTGSTGLPFYGYNNGASTAFSYIDTDGTFRITAKGQQHFSLDGEGLGLGVANPSRKLDVSGDLATTASIARVMNGTAVSVNSNTRRGFLGTSAGTNKCEAILGVANSSDGDSYGTLGLAIGPGVNYAVFGNAFNGTINWAGFFSGALYASSSSAGVKAFMIDHPLDPENKVLIHSSVESDERMNLYRGVTKTDAQGFAWIAVPSWFDALNGDIQYSLTVVGDESDDFVQVKVARKLRDGRFRIRSSAPRVEVNWLLTGVRHDPVSNHYPLEVERLKNKDERGRYYEPEAYGKDKSLGMGYIEETPAQQSTRTSRPPQKK